MLKNSKIVLSIAIISMLSFGGAVRVFAEEASSTNPKGIRPAEIRQELRNNAEAKRAELKAELEKRREEAEVKIEQFREKHRMEVKNRIQKELQKMSERFNSAIERLDKLTSRIDARIVKLKAEGKSTTEAEGFVTDAKAKIAQAKVDAAKLPQIIESSINLMVGSDTASSTPAKGAFEGARTLAKTIKQELEDAHKLLVKAVVSIKGIGEHKGDDNRNASSTGTTTE